MKIAILHEMLIKLWWAEKVVEKWCKMYPQADIFTLIYDEEKTWKIFPKEKINIQVFSLSSQKIYNFTKKQRFCLPFMAKSVEKLDFSEYDIVLCSSSWFAHWAITKPETKFIVYYHSPARYMWDWTNEYKKDLGINSWIKKILLNYPINSLFFKLRQWDYIASKRVDINIANSKNTQNRISKYYKKDSIVIYPPVETNRFKKQYKNTNKNDYYIIVSALTEFKKIEVAINWFNQMPNINLKIVWTWNHREFLEKISKWNISFSWAKYWQELVDLVQNSKWLIFPWEEDFWIVPIEAMAAWKPIFAYRWWWLLETIIEWITWEFFNSKLWEDFVEKFKIFDDNNKNNKYLSIECQKQAELFSDTIFEEKIRNFVEK